MNRRSPSTPLSPVRHGLPLLACTLSALAPGAARAQGPPPAPVRVDPVRMEEVQEMRRVNGELRAVHRSRIAAQEEGVVLEMFVVEGQAVAVGAELARLDRERLELALLALDAERSVAEATLLERDKDLERAQRDLETVRVLAEKEAANPKELADAESDVQSAAARKEQSVQALTVIAARRRLYVRRLADTTIRAPFAGVVVARQAEVGQWVRAGDPVVELVSAGELEAWLEVPQQDWAALVGRPGAIRVQVGTGGPERVVEEYRSVASIDPRARTFAVVVAMPADPGLAPGMSVTAEVPTGVRAVHPTVPNAAILRNEVGPFVYAALPGAEEGSLQAIPMPVEILFRSRERAVVRGGLPPGASVIVEGNERLYPTAPVRVVDDGDVGGGAGGGPAPAPEGGAPEAGGAPAGPPPAESDAEGAR